ncbi:MAG: DUF484 family protein [Pseudomonadota bacterium]
MTSPIDSAAVAQYLTDNPQFFVEHSALLGKVQLTSPLLGRAVSLQERQMEVMREKYKALEFRVTELIRVGQDNEIIADKFQVWTRALLNARNDVDLPHTLVSGLQTVFGVPHATLRLWQVGAAFSHTWFVRDVSDDARLFANSLRLPYCGSNNDFEAVRWLEDTETIQSTAIIPLRLDAESNAFGLLILGSPDAQRFTDDMATDFLNDIGETASAALSCMLY